MAVDVEVLGSAVAGIALYSVLLLVAAWRTYKLLANSLRSDLPVAKAFHVFMLLFSIGALRLVWVVLQLGFQGPEIDYMIAFVLNRAAFLLFLTSYTLMIFSWIEIFHRNYAMKTTQALPRLLPTFMMLNLALYVYQILIIVKLLYDEKREGDVWYDTNILVLVVTFALLSLTFLIYGMALANKLRRSRRSTRPSSEGPGAATKILIATSVFALCFLGRVIMFSYRLITEEYLPYGLFFAFGYVVPELFPSLYQLRLMWRVERSAASARAREHVHAMRNRAADEAAVAPGDSARAPLL